MRRMDGGTGVIWFLRGECHLVWSNDRYLFASNAGSIDIAAGSTKFTADVV